MMWKDQEKKNVNKKPTKNNVFFKLGPTFHGVFVLMFHGYITSIDQQILHPGKILKPKS